MVTAIAFRILGEPASKANSRIPKNVPNGKGGTRTLWIKSEKALGYETDALRQIPSWARQRIEGPVRVTLRIFYSSERPDLDESIVLDVLQDRFKKMGEKRILIQGGCYRNDRQVREKHIYHGIDRANPHTQIEIEPLTPQQVDMLAAPIGTMLKPLEADDGLSF